MVCFIRMKKKRWQVWKWFSWNCHLFCNMPRSVYKNYNIWKLCVLLLMRNSWSSFTFVGMKRFCDGIVYFWIQWENDSFSETHEIGNAFRNGNISLQLSVDVFRQGIAEYYLLEWIGWANRNIHVLVVGMSERI